jgi:glycosyltransferase involved in cell wall biosynthesis
LFFGTYEAQRHPRVTVLMEGLRGRMDVDECNEQLGVDTEARVAGLRRPWRLLPAAVKLLRAWRRLWLRARHVAKPDIVVVGYLGIVDIHLARLLWRDRVLVLDQLTTAADTARDRRLGGSVAAGALDLLDRWAARSADLIVVDTDENRQLIPVRSRARSVVVPVGAPPAWFHRPSRRPKGALRVVFFGLYTPLQGAPVVGEAASMLGDAQIEFTMIGGGQELEIARARAQGARHVEWLEWVEASELPAVVAAHDVCLGIFGESGKALRVVPNKVYQGAAAGCAVVTSDTAPQRRALDKAATFVRPGDPGALAEAIRSLGANRSLLWRMRTSAYRHAEEHFTPQAIAVPLLDAISTKGVPSSTPLE